MAEPLIWKHPSTRYGGLREDTEPFPTVYLLKYAHKDADRLDPMEQSAGFGELPVNRGAELAAQVTGGLEDWDGVEERALKEIDQSGHYSGRRLKQLRSSLPPRLSTDECETTAKEILRNLGYDVT